MRKLITVAWGLAIISTFAAGQFGGSSSRRPAAKKPTKEQEFDTLVSRGRIPAFKFEDYLLGAANLECRAKLDLATGGDREHTLQMEGIVKHPAEEDAVAISKEFDVLRAVDADGNNLLQPKGAPRGGIASGSGSVQRYQSNTFVAFGLHLPAAIVDVPLVKLRKNAYALQEMELGATVILADEREDKETPAIVMEEPITAFGGIRVRVVTLQMGADRDLTIMWRFERPNAGYGGPFIERIAVLDENHEVLARDRWTQGDAFAKTGMMTAKLALARDKVHKYLRFTACTKYHRKTVRFQVDGIFQK